MSDSSASRLVGALIAPTKTFESIAQRPTWVLVMVILTLATIGGGWLAMQHTDLATSTRQQIEKQLEQSHTTMTPEEIDNRVEMVTKISNVTSLAGPVVFVPATFLLIALVFWVGLKLVGGEMRYPVSFSIALHAMLPSLVAAIISIPILLGRGLMSVDEIRRGVVASSPAAFAPEGTSPVVISLLSSLDLFSFWTLALLIIGYRAGTRLRTGLVAAVVLSIWVLYVLGKTGLIAVLPH
jgi:Yip1 domain